MRAVDSITGIMLHVTFLLIAGAIVVDQEAARISMLRQALLALRCLDEVADGILEVDVLGIQRQVPLSIGLQYALQDEMTHLPMHDGDLVELILNRAAEIPG